MLARSRNRGGNSLARPAIALTSPARRSRPRWPQRRKRAYRSGATFPSWPCSSAWATRQGTRTRNTPFDSVGRCLCDCGHRRHAEPHLVRHYRSARLLHFLEEQDERRANDAGDGEEAKVVHVTEQSRLLLQHSVKERRRFAHRGPGAALLGEAALDFGESLLERGIKRRHVGREDRLVRLSAA